MRTELLRTELLNATVRRDALCRRYPKSVRRLEPGTMLSLCLSAYSIACFFAMFV